MSNTINAGIITYNTTGLQSEIVIVPNFKVEIRINANGDSGVTTQIYTRMLPLSAFPSSSLITDTNYTFTGNVSGLVMNGEISGFAINIISLGSQSNITLEYKWILS